MSDSQQEKKKPFRKNTSGSIQSITLKNVHLLSYSSTLEHGRVKQWLVRITV